MKILCLILLFSLTCFAKPIKIAVIDSGYDTTSKIPLCKEKSIDYTSEKTLEDNIDHGKYVVELIEENIGDIDHCYIIFKVFTKKKGNPLITTLNAIKQAIKYKVDYINYSADGGQYDTSEFKSWKSAINHNIIVFISAGNDKLDLDYACIIYPVCYNLDFQVVGNTYPTSNYGTKIKYLQNGYSERDGKKINGTSFGSPIALGRYIKNKHQRNVSSDEGYMTGKIAEAFYVQVGLDQQVDRYVYENTSKDIQKYIGRTTFLTNIIITQQIIIRWTF